MSVFDEWEEANKRFLESWKGKPLSERIEAFLSMVKQCEDAGEDLPINKSLPFLTVVPFLEENINRIADQVFLKDLFLTLGEYPYSTETENYDLDPIF